MFKSIIQNIQYRFLAKVNHQYFKQRSLFFKISLFLALGALEAFTWADPLLAQSKIRSSINDKNTQAHQQKPKTVKLELSDIIQLVIQNNRSLKNSLLNLIIEKQELVEAQSKFKPTITPNFSVSFNESLSSSPSFDLSGTDNFQHSLQIGANVLTPLGTNITLSADPLSDFEILGLEIRQPLMRGAGVRVNQASVKSARLSNTRHVFELKQSSSDQIVEGIKAYHTLIQAQEEVRILSNSLESRQRDLQVLIALVKAGRRAGADLVQLEASVASAEEQLLSARNSLSQANSDLLGIIDTDENLNIFVSQESIQALTDEKLLRPVKNNQEDLLQKAYAQRADYRQANLDIEIAQLDLIEPENNRQWQLDAISNLNLGNDSQATASLELTRTFDDQSLQTAFERARVQVLQRQNDFKDMKEIVKIEVNDRVTNVNSNLAKIAEARRAKELAQQRLKFVQKLRRRAGSRIDIFETISQQDEVVEAQNTELNAIIDYLNARTDLDQSLGIVDIFPNSG